MELGPIHVSTHLSHVQPENSCRTQYSCTGTNEVTIIAFQDNDIQNLLLDVFFFYAELTNVYKGTAGPQ